MQIIKEWEQRKAALKSEKMYPKEIEYIFKQGDKVAKYTIEQTYELESRDPTAQLSKIMQGALKLKELHPSTSRNFAKGTLEFHDGEQIIKRSGDMIYEFVYISDYQRFQTKNEKI